MIWLLHLKVRLLAKCPKCGKENSKPKKTIQNYMFCLECFTCSDCGTYFSVSS